MHAYQGNICMPDDPSPTAFSSPEFFNFDIAAVGLGFHHFDDPELAACRLVERLRPGGVLVILDFLPHGSPVGVSLCLFLLLSFNFRHSLPILLFVTLPISCVSSLPFSTTFSLSQSRFLVTPYGYPRDPLLSAIPIPSRMMIILPTRGTESKQNT